jgi:hypothetical protein
MTNRSGRDVPPWVIAAALVATVAVVAFFGFNAVNGHAPDPGPSKKVYPGMYDLRAEAAKAQAVQGNGQGRTAGGQ